MDRRTLARINDELVPSEVASLCFLCSDVVGRRHLEGVTDARVLFQRLEEKGLLENRCFLSQLLKTIGRMDLHSKVETDSRPTGAEVLSPYRVMLHQLYEDMTKSTFESMKFLLSETPELGRRKIETFKTALDVFVEMEKTGLLSNTSLLGLLTVLEQLDQKLVGIVQNYMQEEARRSQITQPPKVSNDYERINDSPQPSLPVCETQPSNAEGRVRLNSTEADTQVISALDPTEYYTLVNNPYGQCVIINNEDFVEMPRRQGTAVDEKVITSLFGRLGFRVVVHNNLTADEMRRVLNELSRRNFSKEDALVVFVLSHGEKECVFGTDGKEVSLKQLTQPFTSFGAPTLAEKPKLFFIQACQGSGYQRGSLPCPPRPLQEEDEERRQSQLQTDAGPVRGERVAWEADFLMGMATVQDCKSFRNIHSGSIYIQELCKQLTSSAESRQNDDILSVLTRVNKEVSKGEYLSHKQMPEPKYTLTKKLVLKLV